MKTRLKNGLRISDHGLVLDPSTGHSFKLNPTGLTILKLMAEGENEDGIFEKVSVEYQLSRIEFDRHYKDFMAVLESNHLLE